MRIVNIGPFYIDNASSIGLIGYKVPHKKPTAPIDLHKLVVTNAFSSKTERID
jgi:hypothetical protein